MVGIGISKLPRPPRQYRLNKIKGDLKAIVRFETLAESIEEDQRRGKLIKRAQKRFSDQFKGKLNRRARRLSDRLLSSKNGTPCPKSMASRRYMRRMRLRVHGWLWKLVEEAVAPAFVTMWRANWVISADKLVDVDPHKLIKQLRNDLSRCMPGPMKGWLFASLHACFDSSDNTYRLHLHGQAHGDMIDRIEALRTKWPRKYLRSQGHGDTGSITIIRVQTDLPKTVTYSLQSFWNHKFFHNPTTGERQMIEQRRRIPEPYHSLALAWIDQFRLEDMTLLIGLRCGRDGFVCAN
ncbi:hypothetical protein [Blastomonas sp.]|uniref:hypothetical protein n=1 Tax=Blastomonas sp. TaxID=1909299 RepID=UPI00391CF354